jgi:phage repressor protein C with HTH and peptisase S24 domain
MMTELPPLIGTPGYLMTAEERVAHLVALVGGPVKAAAIIGKTRTHVDNMRKSDAPLRLDDVLALAREAGVSLDWVATGYQVRPDLLERASRPGGELADAGTPGFGGLPGFARLQPVKPELVMAAGRTIERWTPSDIAVSAQWLDSAFGLSTDTARYALAGDGGMEPLIGRGTFVIVDGRETALRTGVYLVEVGDELLPRRLSRMPGGSSELIADADPRWRYVLPADAAQGPALHRIVWAGRAL